MGAKEPNPSPNRHNKNAVRKPRGSPAPPPKNRKLSIDEKPPISPAPLEDYDVDTNDLLERIEWLENRINDLERKFEYHSGSLLKNGVIDREVWLNL